MDELRNRGLGRTFATSLVWLLFAFVSLQMALHVLSGLALIDAARADSLAVDHVAAFDKDTTQLMGWVVLAGVLGIVLLIGWVRRFRIDREALLGAPLNLYAVIPDSHTAPRLPVSPSWLWVVLGVVLVAGFLVRSLPTATLDETSFAWLLTAMAHFARAAIGIGIAAMVFLTQLRMERAMKSTFGDWASAI
jgi:hypothetical protein